MAIYEHRELELSGLRTSRAIYYLRSFMPRVLKLFSEDELLALVEILRYGTHDEQLTAVEAIEKTVIGAMIKLEPETGASGSRDFKKWIVVHFQLAEQVGYSNGSPPTRRVASDRSTCSWLA